MSDDGGAGSATDQSDKGSATGPPEGTTADQTKGQAGDQGAAGATPGTPDPESPEELKKALADQRRVNRDLRAGGNELAKKAKQFDELTEANKSEMQKAADRAAAAEERAITAESGRLRLLAAATHELHPDLVDFLGTGTAEEIDARADTMARVINETVAAQLAGRNGQAGQAGGPGRPVESLRPGAQPAAASNSRDPNSAFRNMLNATRQ
jgi:hypothetical protein